MVASDRPKPAVSIDRGRTGHHSPSLGALDRMALFNPERLSVTVE